jgi:hypothetical protein
MPKSINRAFGEDPVELRECARMANKLQTAGDPAPEEAKSVTANLAAAFPQARLTAPSPTQQSWTAVGRIHDWVLNLDSLAGPVELEGGGLRWACSSLGGRLLAWTRLAGPTGLLFGLSVEPL